MQTLWKPKVSISVKSTISAGSFFNLVIHKSSKLIEPKQSVQCCIDQVYVDEPKQFGESSSDF